MSEYFYQGYIIYDWMGSKDILNLKGHKKELFALIYSFSKDGNNTYHGSLNYLSRTIGATKPTIIKYLDELEKDNLIIKKSKNDGVTKNEYFVNLSVVKEIYLSVVKSFDSSSKGILPDSSKGILLNNNNIDNNNNKGDLSLFSESEKKKKSATAKRIFENSDMNDFETVRNKIMKNKDLVKKYSGADLRHYIEKVKRWSDKSGKKTTDRGWYAYILDFMDSDLKNQSLVMLKKKARSEQEQLKQEHTHSHTNF